MKNFKKLLCVLLAVVTVLSSLLIVPTSAKTNSIKGTQITRLYSTHEYINLFWNPVSNVTGYQIRVSTNKNFKTGETWWAKKAAYRQILSDKLMPNTRYYFRIRTYKKSGKTKKYSKWSSVKSIKTKKSCTNNNNHSTLGNSGKWVDSKAECYDVYGDECDYWEEKYNEGKISMDEYLDNVPGGFEALQCAYCGKWTVEFNYDLFGGVFWKHPAPAHID